MCVADLLKQENDFDERTAVLGFLVTLQYSIETKLWDELIDKNDNTNCTDETSEKWLA